MPDLMSAPSQAATPTTSLMIGQDKPGVMSGEGLRNGLNAFFADTRDDIFSWGVASICSSILLLLLYAVLPKVRRTPGWLILYSSICEVYVAFGFVALSMVGGADVMVDGRPTVNIEQKLCHEYGALLLSILGFDMAAHSWKLLMYIDLIVVYHNPFRPNTARPLYHLAVVLIAILWVVAIRSTDVMCAADSPSNHDTYVNVLTLTWGFVYAPFLLFVLLGGSLYIAVKALLSRDKSSNRISRLARQRVMQHCLFYLLLYGMLLGMLAAAYTAYQMLSAPLLPWRIFAHCTAALTSGRPCFGFLGWALINGVGGGSGNFLSWCSGGGSGGRDSTGASTIATPKGLRQPLLGDAPTSAAHWAWEQRESYSGGGGGGSAGIPPRRSEAGAGMAPAAEPPSGGDGGSPPSREGGGVYEAGFKEELRYELVTDVAVAISELAEREAREEYYQNRDGSGLPSCGSGFFCGAKEMISATTPGGSAGSLAPAAVPITTGAPSPSSPAGGSATDLSESLTDLLSPGAPPSPTKWRRGSGDATGGGGNVATASQHGGSMDYRPTHVQNYAVAHFRAIRETFGITAESFAAAFKRSLPESADSERRLRESVSEGATGSFFYWVKHPDGSDTGYIVKQITKAEKNTLMSILPAYKAHVQARGGNSLLQYLSCHSMNLRWQWSGKVYFVVMRNFFPVRPQLSFDLKGATANRRALKTWELHQSQTVAGLYSTLRDWEWMDIGMTTDLEDRDRARLWAMITADCDFLQRQNLLDYSLLIGIYRPPSSLLPNEKQSRLNQLAQQCRGTGAVSRDRQKVYFLGIIDVLEKFTIRWRVQRVILRLLYGLAMRWTSGDGISAMPPPLYADRFRTFMGMEVLHIEEDPREGSILDERWRAGRWIADLCNFLRKCYGLPQLERGARKGGKARWGPLWERRRRGLVKQRIVSEHEDQSARIKELEEHVSILEYELACCRGVHPSAAHLPGTCQSSCGSNVSSSDRAMTVDHYSLDHRDRRQSKEPPEGGDAAV